MWENNEKILISLTEFGRSVLARHHQMASALILVPDQLGPRLWAGKPIIWQRDALDGATVMSQAAFSTVVCQKNSPFLLSSKLERKQRLFFLLICLLDSHSWPRVTVTWCLISGLTLFCFPKESSSRKVIVMWLLFKEWSSNIVASLVIECVTKLFMHSHALQRLFATLKMMVFLPSGFATAITVLALLHRCLSTKSIYWTMKKQHDICLWRIRLSPPAERCQCIVEAEYRGTGREIISPTL